MVEGWLSEQIEKIRNLQGQTVTRLVAVEMAFRGGEGDGPPQFDDPALPFLQVCALYLHLGSGETVKFVTYQNDGAFGLELTSEAEPWETKPDAGSHDSIYRTRELSSFPTGLIRSVDVVRDSDGEISEVLLDISGETILMVTGEVYEREDGKLSVVKGDESILLFRQPGLKVQVRFIRPSADV